MNIDLLQGDCLEILKQGPSDSIDALVTDPPAGISFMGKEWDDDKGGRDAWIAWLTEVMRECYRVMKPGAHGLVWALPRTSHWTATALENAGFEVRDRVQHIFGSGFPKSLDVSKAIDKAAGAEREVVGSKLDLPGYHLHAGERGGEALGQGLNGHTFDERLKASQITAPATDAAKLWAGWGTALKPACEDWWLIRKPLSEKTVAANVLKWGTGALNIDGGRIETSSADAKAMERCNSANSGRNKIHAGTDSSFGRPTVSGAMDTTRGRFPSHLILDEHAAALLDEQSGKLTSGGGNKRQQSQDGGYGKGFAGVDDIREPNTGGASRFFYVAKASKSDKNDGLEERGNTHPTVKSTKLMEYLLKLITPPGGTVLDCFMGSGTTGVAAITLGFNFVGVEQNPEYHAIAEARIKAKEAA